MKMRKIYISERFIIKDNPGYQNRLNSLEFNEIVSADSELCKRRYSDLDFMEFPSTSKLDIDLSAYSLKIYEQYICIEEINKDFKEETIINFEFCGIDVMDKFNTNSWITNYGIPYDLSGFNYTQYGLMKDISSVSKWLSKRNSDKTFLELAQNEFKLVAVWRKNITI